MSTTSEQLEVSQASTNSSSSDVITPSKSVTISIPPINLTILERKPLTRRWSCGTQSARESNERSLMKQSSTAQVEKLLNLSTEIVRMAPLTPPVENPQSILRAKLSKSIQANISVSQINLLVGVESMNNRLLDGTSILSESDSNSPICEDHK